MVLNQQISVCYDIHSLIDLHISPMWLFPHFTARETEAQVHTADSKGILSPGPTLSSILLKFCGVIIVFVIYEQ